MVHSCNRDANPLPGAAPSTSAKSGGPSADPQTRAQPGRTGLGWGCAGTPGGHLGATSLCWSGALGPRPAAAPLQGELTPGVGSQFSESGGTGGGTKPPGLGACELVPLGQ